ncbi:glycosyltransferase family 32 protein [Treponema brennaborense]|uniref:Glycosyltransferase sugar-binding region containing DXD motif n=1 Tax=Treponema brennaborense (strain DSM 12168 / CIP 105900 / DD5/3) TaxID=906968 RepID=F4LIE2_TREBD|nr:glycosyltransferase [Treponema brennaborense]AEE16183.1 glycosyltransferase sugar-binding region containing DXD motif [Treponema brennaborense DSM 12168]
MIPKIIHLCWLSGDEYPENIKKCINSVYEKLPNYEIKIWTKENFDVGSVSWVKQAFDSKKYAFAADYIRFWSLYNYGGIYLDSDVEVVKNFDFFLNVKSFIGFEYLNIPEAAVVGAEEGTDWVKTCLDWYDGKSFFAENGEMKKDVVPRLVKRVLEKKYNQKIVDTGKIREFEGLTIYPYFYFSPKNYFTGKIKVEDKTVCIHHFASAWGPNKKRKWTLVLHNSCIHLMGKRLHDKLFRLIRPLPKTFNGEEI